MAVVQTQGRPDLREHEGLGHAVVHGDVSLPGNGIIKDSQLQVTELLRDPSPPLGTPRLPQHPLGVDL